ncbi:MAG: hypothetical protein MJ071_08710 [Oscillospiraceae bacterium]|nr:hypothetical protein [Oscillospiraceae bacterium]
MMLFRLIADITDARLSTEIQQAIEPWLLAHSGITGLQYADRCLSCLISIPPKKADEQTAERITELISFASDFRMAGCCQSCGTDRDYSFYLLDDAGVTICPQCESTLQQKIEEIAEKKQQYPVSWSGTVMAGLVGAALLFVLIYLLLAANLIVYPVTYVCVLAALLLCKKWGKKLHYVSLSIIGGLCLISCVLATFFSTAHEMALNNQENCTNAQALCSGVEELREMYSNFTEEELAEFDEDGEFIISASELDEKYQLGMLIQETQTTKDCILRFNELMRQEIFRDYRNEYRRRLILNIIAVFVSLSISAPAMLRQSNGRHTLRRIPE